ncbi:glycosyltransferase [Dyadobacter psychrotolerans]|uniref:Glycosyltransferase n=1 Tax=Dyadobacter psychrotolerans TaxID=2541721 RepID=A0A4R5DRV4_9BACT|nr:glycosyltransferase [Dyadobacter psychrotolerans]TDE17059.1 glycosyltransferase [Dyadobacter psychrotolerans]
MGLRHEHANTGCVKLKCTRSGTTIELSTAESNNDYSSGLTVILTVWKRNNLKEQLQALQNQTIRPNQIWVLQNEKYVNAEDIINKFPQVQYIKSSINLKYFGRFSLAQYVNTKHVWILDDDVVPGKKWIEMCLNMQSVNSCIISCAGRRIPNETYYLGDRKDIFKYYYGDVSPGLAYHFCENNTVVDFGCNGWFFEKKLIELFWSTPPLNLEMSEDMHLSAICKLKLASKQLC